MTNIAHDFDHVVDGLPGWVREPDDDYNVDIDPGYDEIASRANVPILILVGETIHAWDNADGDFIKLPYRMVDGRVVGDAG